MAGGLTQSRQKKYQSRRSNLRLSTEINIAPLVDVMLVLLIIFMVTAPILTVGIPVDLPKTAAAKTNDLEEPLVVSINAEGKLFLKETEMDLDHILNELKALSQKDPDAKVYVRGDQKLSYGKIMDLMGAIAASGFQKVSLIAEMPTMPIDSKTPVSLASQSHQKKTPSKVKRG